MTDSSKPANELLTNGAPSARDGTPDGTASTEALHAAGEPNSLPTTWCKVCQADVRPLGKGKCPRCGTFLKLNFVARRHPVNKLRWQQLLDMLVADYEPRSTLRRSMCEHLAAILEQLETMKPGGADHQRLVQLSQLLGASLEESRTVRESGALALSLEDETTEQLEARLVRLLEAVRSARLPPLGALGGDRSPVGKTQDPAETSAETGAPAVPQAPEQPAPTSPCPYCHRSPCVGPDHQHYATLHALDPEQVQKRDAEANAVMMKMVGKPLPDWYPR